MTDTTLTPLDPGNQPDETTMADLSPAERRRQRVRDMILNAAEKVFAEEGETGLSIRRLADEIDYSPAAIYKYFGSKDDLVEELKSAFFARLMSKVEATYAAHEQYLDRCRACIQTYIYTALERPHHYTAAFSGVQEHDAGGDEARWDEFVESTSGQAYIMFRDLIDQGRQQGVFPEIDTAVATKSAWASMHGLVMLMIHLPHFPGSFPDSEAIDRETFIARHADLLVRGLSAKKM